MENRYQNTPENINSLKADEIFVFGSNLNGNHMGGAARLAAEKFGAQNGVGEGPTGQAYAFPTLTEAMAKRTLSSLTKSVDKLIQYANENSTKLFLVTKVGCGIAGYNEEEMKELFSRSDIPANVVLPEGWVKRLWKSLPLDMSSHGHKFEIGKWYEEDDILICHRGFHASELIVDAMRYVSCEVLARVEVRGESQIQSDKQCWSEMRVIRAWFWKEEDSVSLSIYSAELVLKYFESVYPNDDRPRKALEAAKRYLKTPSLVNAHTAFKAARAAYAASKAANAASIASKAAHAAYCAYAASSAMVGKKIHNWIVKRTKILEEIK